MSYCTDVNAGDIYGKEGGVEGAVSITTILMCPCSPLMREVSRTGRAGRGHIYQDHPCYFVQKQHSHHSWRYRRKQCRTLDSRLLDRIPTDRAYGWQTPLEIYNNTIVSAAWECWTDSDYTLTAANNGVRYWAVQDIQQHICQQRKFAGAGKLWQFHNYSQELRRYGTTISIQSSGVQWAIVPEAENGSICGSHYVYTTAATFASAVVSGGGISGVEAHGVAGAPTFTGTGSMLNSISSLAGLLAPGQAARTALQAAQRVTWARGAALSSRLR